MDLDKLILVIQVHMKLPFENIRCFHKSKELKTYQYGTKVVIRHTHGQKSTNILWVKKLQQCWHKK
jgi:hypothetical protein